MARDCKLMTPIRKTVAIKSQGTKQKNYWMENEEKESSMISLCATENQNLWNLDSGFPEHMTGGPNKFITLKYNKGKVTFGDKFSSKIIGKGTVVVNNKIKAKMYY